MRLAPASMRGGAVPSGAARHALNLAPLDAALGGGLVRGAVHEVYAAEADDAAAAAGFVLGVATTMARAAHRNGEGRGGVVLWLRVVRSARLGGVTQASGWAELGGAPGHGLVGLVPDGMALLRAAVDALRCGALAAVVAESHGPLRELDLTASRRLTLAAERSGVPLFLLRHDATPVPSAAQTRWQVAAAPSQALPGNAPGRPSFDVTLLRQKAGPAGMDWRLEWDRDDCQFREPALPGAVVSVPVHRSVDDRGAGSGTGAADAGGGGSGTRRHAA